MALIDYLIVLVDNMAWQCNDTNNKSWTKIYLKIAFLKAVLTQITVDIAQSIQLQYNPSLLMKKIANIRS